MSTSPSIAVPGREPKVPSSPEVTAIVQDTDGERRNSSYVEVSKLTTPSAARLPPAILLPDDSSSTKIYDDLAPAPSPPKGPRNSYDFGTIIPSKFFQLRWIIFSSFVAIPLSIVLFFYVYEALLSITPELGPLLFSPSRTLLVVTIVSQVLGSFILVLFQSVFDRLRWQLVSKESGIGLRTFLGLSGGTSLFGVIRLVYRGRGGISTFWCAQRLILPALCLIVSVILKSDVTFKNVYTPLETVLVLAGIAPLNATLLEEYYQTSVMAIYFATYTSTILGSSNFVTGIDPVFCSGISNCTSIFLPGGIFNTRRLHPDVQPNLNVTLLSDSLLDNVPAIVIKDAPGYQVEFSPINKNFSFLRNDCTMYGQTQGEGLYLCLASYNSTLMAGWSVCPTGIVGSCFTNTSWANPLQQTISMSTFKRYATVAYDTQNLSILSIESISSPEQIEIDPIQLRRVHSKVLTPISNGSSEDLTLVNTLLVETGWLLRLYRDDYTNSLQLPLDLLKGFLLVPIQFSTNAWLWINSTQLYKNTTLFALPDDLETVAFTARPTYRAIAAPWTVGTFIATVSFLLIWCNCILIHILTCKTAAPNASSFLEMDISSKSSGLPLGGLTQDLSTMLRDRALGNSESRAMIARLNHKRIRLVGMVGEGGKEFLVLVDDDEIKSSLCDVHGPKQGRAYF